MMLSIQENNNMEASTILVEYLEKHYSGYTPQKQKMLKQKLAVDTRMTRSKEWETILGEFNSMYPEHDQECQQLLSMISKNQISQYLGQTSKILAFMQGMQTLFQSSYDQDLNPKDKAKCFLYFMLCNFQQFNNVFYNEFNEKLTALITLLIEIFETNNDAKYLKRKFFQNQPKKDQSLNLFESHIQSNKTRKQEVVDRLLQERQKVQQKSTLTPQKTWQQESLKTQVEQRERPV